MASLAELRFDDGGDDRADVLIRSASELLEEGGLEGLTIRAVLLRSGFARRAFYELFSSKDDLVLAVFENTLTNAARQFRAQAADAHDPVDALRMIVTGIVVGQLGFGSATSRRSAALSQEHLRLAQTRPKDLQAALQPLLALICEIITEGMKRGQLRDSDPHFQATLVYNFVSATVHVELLTEENGYADLSRREQLSDYIWDFCHRALIA